MSQSRRAISPVIATIVIVIVALAVSMGGGFWLTGTVPAFAMYEEIRISSSYIEDSNTAFFYIKNTGNAEATIDSVQVNGLGPQGSGWSATSTHLKPGEATKITVTASDYPVTTYSSGIVYEFTINTAAGGRYPTKARAP